MKVCFLFAFNASEMGLSNSILTLIVVSTIVFLSGLQKAQERMSIRT